MRIELGRSAVREAAAGDRRERGVGERSITSAAAS